MTSVNAELSIPLIFHRRDQLKTIDTIEFNPGRNIIKSSESCKSSKTKIEHPE